MVTFIGTTHWQPSSDPVWGGGGYGLDTAKIPYRGRATGKQAFIDSLRRFSAMPGYPGMYYLTHSDDGGTVFPTVELYFEGIKKEIPPAKPEDARTSQTFALLDGDDLKLTLQYQAARTTWTWYEKQAPGDTPRYSTANLKPNLLTGARVQSDGTDIELTKELSEYIATHTQASDVVTDYTITPLVPGALWECKATIDYCLRKITPA